MQISFLNQTALSIFAVYISSLQSDWWMVDDTYDKLNVVQSGYFGFESLDTDLQAVVEGFLVKTSLKDQKVLIAIHQIHGNERLKIRQLIWI